MESQDIERTSTSAFKIRSTCSITDNDDELEVNYCIRLVLFNCINTNFRSNNETILNKHLCQINNIHINLIMFSELFYINISFLDGSFTLRRSKNMKVRKNRFCNSSQIQISKKRKPCWNIHFKKIFLFVF